MKTIARPEANKEEGVSPLSTGVGVGAVPQALAPGAKTPRTFITLIFLLVVASAAVWFHPRSAENTASGTVRRGSIMESVYGIGTVTATKSFQFRPGVTNTVARLFVKEGDRVREGEALVDFQGGTRVSAPFEGTVTRLPVKAGENVFGPTAVVEVVDLMDRYLVVTLEQRGAIRVRRGQKARLSFDGGRERSYDGVVESVYSSGSDFLVRIGVSGLPPQILPGMTADVAIGISERRDVLLAPAAAVDGGVVRVRREQGKPLIVPVSTGVVDGEAVEIVSGAVREGDRLLIPGKGAP